MGVVYKALVYKAKDTRLHQSEEPYQDFRLQGAVVASVQRYMNGCEMVMIALLQKAVYLHDIRIALAHGRKHPFPVR